MTRLGAFCAVVLGISSLAPDARAVAPAGRFTANGSTVYDTKTKLTWQKSPSGQFTWANAKAACTALNTGGATGWRLPFLKELITLLDYTVPGGTYPQAPFSVQGGYISFWSATPVADSISTGQAWTVDFFLGLTSPTAVANTNGALCVK
jgi:hypothetical protein